MAKDSSPGGGDAFNRLSAAIRELQAQVTEDVLNLRARVLELEQELEEIRAEGNGQPGEKDEPPAKTPAAKRTTGTKATQAKAPKGSRSKP
jgi:cell division septum initiation protein DivIVA